MSNVKSTDATVWGLGLVQNFNNAATEWYLGYRNFCSGPQQRRHLHSRHA